MRERAAPAERGGGNAGGGGDGESRTTARRLSDGGVLGEHLAALAAQTSPMQRQPAPFKALPSVLFGGRYGAGRYLGRGASASVWEAKHSDTSLRVAVKVFDQGSKDMRQAHREMRVLSRVQHPRILEAFEVVETSLCAHLVCELVDGESLRSFAQRQPGHRLSETVARHLYQQVVEGVSFCHERLVVHRDLKLENLLLDSAKETVKIIDFGFAAQVQSKDTRLRAFCGTPSYMAPEIIRGEGYIGFATDVWALGVVIFALLAGSLPFAGRTELQLYAKIRRGAFAFPDTIPELAKRLIKAALRIDASTRPASTAILRHPFVTGVPPSTSTEALGPTAAGAASPLGARDAGRRERRVSLHGNAGDENARPAGKVGCASPSLVSGRGTAPRTSRLSLAEKDLTRAASLWSGAEKARTLTGPILGGS